MSSSLKNELSSSDFEVDANEMQSRSRVQRAKLIHGLRTGLTALALVAGIAVLGLSADALSVYNATYLPADFLLPLWPENFDIGPTTSLVAGSAMVTAMNAVSLVASKNKLVRGRLVAHSAAILAAPVVAFTASLVTVVFFYAINASASVDSLHSWTCRWRSVPMYTRPYFGTLCRESQAAVALSVLLVPLELIILVTAYLQAMMEKKMQVVCT
ncbi:uncharacterized protein MAM_01593 [Metarhizium album ARSEF 1941]|uniref:Uncharacterized protein n=1 Tax=Metarhizium album (strain ARSEF 1941) TaxID=1081103 RepID=A0A0B2X5V1_METAS|nr:uncharacterized protein MAM_01593 [Metarhizium album ARSEF 1941]KHO00815.1 hypothetical protein MAM_01593 [Metarhizium album ARSEF 1941]